MLSTSGLSAGSDRARIGWWLFVGLLALAAAFLTYSFVGMVSLGIFGYYATRPIYDRIDDHVGWDGAAAWITVGLIIVPIVLLSLYAGFRVFQQAHIFLSGGGGEQTLGLVGQFVDVDALTEGQRRSLDAVVNNPGQVLSQPRQTLQSALTVGLKAVQGIVGALVLVALSITLSAFLLINQEELSDGLAELFGGRDTTAYAYASAVDQDLESIWFGNLLFAAVMSVIAGITYWGTNLLAPEGLAIPMFWLLAFLTGAASLIPIVVGKIVYVPVVGWLAVQAIQTDGAALSFVGIVLVVYFVVLDVLPQALIQPYVSGRKLDMMMLLFGYLLGPILFGWYGFFFLPIVFVVMLETIRIVLPELVHGDRLTPTVSLGEGVGAEPNVDPDVEAGEPVTDDDPAAGDDPATGDD